MGFLYLSAMPQELINTTNYTHAVCVRNSWRAFAGSRKFSLRLTVVTYQVHDLRTLHHHRRSLNFDRNGRQPKQITCWQRQQKVCEHLEDNQLYMWVFLNWSRVDPMRGVTNVFQLLCVWAYGWCVFWSLPKSPRAPRSYFSGSMVLYEYGVMSGAWLMTHFAGLPASRKEEEKRTTLVRLCPASSSGRKVRRDYIHREISHFVSKICVWRDEPNRSKSLVCRSNDNKHGCLWYLIFRHCENSKQTRESTRCRSRSVKFTQIFTLCGTFAGQKALRFTSHYTCMPHANSCRV